MLLEVEVAGVEEGPEPAVVGLGEEDVPQLAEDVRDDEDEKRRDRQGGRAEVEAANHVSR